MRAVLQATTNQQSDRVYSYLSYWNVSGLQQQSGDVFGRQRFPNGSFYLGNQVRMERAARCHLQEQNDSLFSVGVVLGHAEAVRHLLKRLHCNEERKAKPRG